MNFVVFCRIFSNISIAYREDGWDGCGERWEKSQLGYPWSSHDTHTMAHASLVGHRGSGSNIRSPPTQLVPSIGIMVPVVILVVILEDWQNSLQESRLINI